METATKRIPKIGMAVEVQGEHDKAPVRYVTTVEVAPAGLIFRMRNPKGKVWTMFWSDAVESCDCPDFAFRHEGMGTRCKHLAALAVLELIPTLKLIDLGDPDANCLMAPGFLPCMS